ncbi:MAG TPA: PAS domain-containing sensor histidine kinase [Burkholderiales bacterium]|nr:PAS domain-containing sensor histidine kinase [Burkholderiales bacterium]
MGDSPLPPQVQAVLEEDLAELYEDAPAGYASALPDGTLVKVNSTLCRWSGHSKEDLLGRRFRQLFNVPGRIYYETHLAPLLAMQGSLNEVALDLVCRDGRVLPVIVNATRKDTPQGEPLVVRFTLFNATDRRRYELQLLEARRGAEAAARAKSDMVAMLSHDIRTPLASIFAASDVLALSTLAPDQQTAVRIIKSSSAAMLALVDQVLEQGRAEATALYPRPFDLRALAMELTANLQPVAAAKGIALSCTVDEKLPPQVVGDATKIGQVLGNLASNALKFTDKGSVRIELSVAALEPAHLDVAVRVADTGVGIPADFLPFVFDEYRQANPEIRARYGGAGLGLAISRKLVAAHGGELRARSELGQGSEFWFTLRLASAA